MEIHNESCTRCQVSVDMLLRWNPVTEDVEGAVERVKSYRVYIGERAGEYLWVRDSGTEPHYTVRGLRRGVRYYFAVTAYDFWGNEGEFSTEVSGIAF